MACSVKWPPKLEGEEEYEQWKEDLNIWCSLTSIEKGKQALAVYLSLSGRARVAASEIPKERLEQDNGIETLLAKLDVLFLEDKGRRKFSAFEDLYLLKRERNKEIKCFLAEFEHAYHKVTKQGLTLDDSVLAYMLLVSCGFDEKEKQLVMSAIREVTYANMKATISKIFVNLAMGVKEQSAGGSSFSTIPIKSEPLFVDEDSGVEVGDALYVGRGKRSWRSFRTRRGYRSRGRQQQGVEFQQQTGGGRKKNPLGLDGKVSRCIICDSIYHWARDCPDAYENKYAGVNNEPVNLFMGYVNDKENDDGFDRLQRLVNEASGYAVIDSGCSNTVCGSKWLEDHLNSLSDYERELIKEESSCSTFTFGNGVTVTSHKKVNFPCHIGKMYATITTDVVDCSLPLLLSRVSMKKARMIINFETDQVKVNGNQSIIDLKTSSTGHYLLPISL